jgi:hypothetical protein
MDVSRKNEKNSSQNKNLHKAEISPQQEYATEVLPVQFDTRVMPGPRQGLSITGNRGNTQE